MTNNKNGADLECSNTTVLFVEEGKMSGTKESETMQSSGLNKKRIIVIVINTAAK